MKRTAETIWITILLFLITAFPTFLFAEPRAAWGYQNDLAPEHWGNLHPSYATCGAGTQQSPIDLNAFTDVPLKPIPYHYRPNSKMIFNTGNAILLDFWPGGRIRLDGRSFELKQIRFHVPSEHRIFGESYPMEAHLIHADQNGNLAIVAILFEEGTESMALKKAWKRMPYYHGEAYRFSSHHISAVELLPGDHDYYRYEGSLTTPPCTENVTWIVLKKPNTASWHQLQLFYDVIGNANNRPLQPHNEREIFE